MKNLISKWKRIMSLVLSVCLVMTLMPVGGTGSAAYGAERLEGAACGSTEGCTGVYHNGFCTECGGYQPAVLSQASFYEISNAGQLYWFAEFVNGNAGNGLVNGWLTKDIVINEKVLNGDGTLVSSESSLRGWMPIGTAENPFKGQFRGNGFSISGIYCVMPEDGGGAGLFAFTHNAELRDFAVLDSWFAASGETGSVGSIAADSAGTNIFNCYSEASVNSAFAAGGIVGISLNDYMLQCGYAGTVTVSDNLSEVGGLLGGTRTVYGTNKMSVVSGCYNRGTVVNTYTGGSRIYNTGALIGNPSYVFLSNSYYVPSKWQSVGLTEKNTGSCHVEEESVLCKEISSFSDGEVCGLIETHTSLWSYTEGTHAAVCILCGAKDQEGVHDLNDTCNEGGDCIVCGYTIQPGMHAYDDNTCMICGNVCTAHIFGADNNCTVCEHQLVPVTDIQFERHSASQDAVQGEKLNLTEGVTVLPEHADYQDITWYIVSDGVETAIPADTYNAFSASAAGTLTLRGKIENGAGMGTAYAEDFTFTVEAVANEYDILKSPVTIEAAGGGYLIITHDGRSYQVSSDVMVRVYGDGETVTSNGITIEEGASVNLILDSCTITGENSVSPVAIAPSADVSITLIGRNQLTGGAYMPGIYVPTGASVTIEGVGSLEVTGSKEGGAAIGGGGSNIFKEPGNGTITINSGTINAQSYGLAAAIGASIWGNMGNITINGGSVTAVNHEYNYSGAAGIGAAGAYDNLSGRITINGGKIEAVGGPNAAGIGSSHSQAAPHITINGGTIRATGQATYDIGPGWGCETGTVTINGGNVYAAGTEGIGGSITNGSEALSLYTITLKGLNDTAIESLITEMNAGGSAIPYGFTDVMPINNTLYFYLPSGSQPTCVVSDGINYIGMLSETNTGTFICEHIHVATLKEATCQTRAVCDVCGIDVGEFNPDNHESTAYTYEADKKVPGILHTVKHACCGAVKETVRHTMENGICTVCKHNEQPDAENGVYLISNAGQLLWFNEYLRDGTDHLSANARLTADIDMTDTVWITPAGTPNYINDVNYTETGYQGTFDGDGHVISNITIKGGDLFGGETPLGLFGSLSGIVKHLGMEEVTLDYTDLIGPSAGMITTQILGGKVSNCFVKNTKRIGGAFYGSASSGGITVRNLGGTIENCYVTGHTLSGYRNGGIAACNQGMEENTTRIGKIVHCYTDYNKLADSKYLGTVTDSAYGVSAEAFASGEIAYKLNGSKSTGDLVWYQTLTGEDKQDYPQFHGAVVFHDSTSESYTNHIHSWTYRAEGNSITAVCADTDQNCPNTNGGSVTIAASADPTYTGSAIEANVTDLLETGDLCHVEYTAQGDSALTEGKPVNTGSYTAAITLGGQTISAAYTIDPASIAGAAVTAAPTAVTYNGQAQKPVVTVNLDGKILTSDDYTVSYSDNTNAGTATVTVTGRGNYAETASGTFTIGKAAPAAADFVFTAPTGLTYDGQAKSAGLVSAVSITGMGGITVKYYQGNTEVSPADAGTYTVKIDVAEGTNYNAVTDLTDAAWTFTIEKAEAAFTAPQAISGLVYNGSSQALVTAGSTDHGKMMYSLNGTDWSENIPAAANAGEYTVYYKVLGDANHMDSDEGSVTVTIVRAVPEIGTVSGTIPANETSAEEIELSRTNGTVAGSLTVDNTEAVLVWGENTVAYTFTPTDTANYETVQGAVTVEVTDTIAPTGEVKLEEKKWTSLLNTITFGMFFNETVELEVSASDNLSGVLIVKYFEASAPVSDVSTITEWETLRSGSITVTPEDAKQFIYYFCIPDNAGNLTYLSTDGMEFDLSAPVITGVTDGDTYYTTQKAQISDKNLAEGELTERVLAGNVEETYTVTAADKAGNSTTVTIHMKPIASISQSIQDLTVDGVTSDDSAAIKAVEDALAAVDRTYASDEEVQALNQAQDNVDALQAAAAQKVLKEAMAALAHITKENVKISDEQAVKDAKTQLESLLTDEAYSEAEKTAVQAELNRIGELQKRIEALKMPAGGSGGYVPVQKPEADDVEPEDDVKILMDKIDGIQLVTRSKSTKLNGRKAIKIWWFEADGDDADFFDGYQVFRSVKRYSGFGRKPIFTTAKTSYTNNKALETGNTYYYKVRGYVELDGKKYYSDWSKKAWRKF